VEAIAGLDLGGCCDKTGRRYTPRTRFATSGAGTDGSIEETSVLRGEEFVNRFNELSRHLAKVSQQRPDTRFYSLVDEAAARDAAVRTYADDLKDYADLRNAIVHGTSELMAEPTEETLRRFCDILGEVLRPKQLLELSTHPPLRPFQPNDRLVDALRYMRENDFSQIVVRDGESLGLVSVEGVAQWLESESEDDIISVNDARVHDALKNEPSGSFTLLGRNRNIYDARAAFFEALNSKHPRLFAIIVTHSGRTTEKPLGIVTAWDIFEYTRAHGA
jgi:CBS domain-containing protein